MKSEFTLTVPLEISKIVYFTSSIIINIFVFHVRSKFPVKLICFIILGSISNAFCLLRLIAIKI